MRITVAFLLAIVIVGCARLTVQPTPAPPMPTATARIVSFIVRTNRSPYRPPVELTWSNSPSPNVIGYYIYQGTNSGSYYTNFFTSNSFTIVTNLLRNTRYFFAGAALNSDGIRSVLSTETSFSGFLPPVTWFNVTESGTNIYSLQCTNGTQYFMLTSTSLLSCGDMQHWTNVPACAGATISNAVMSFTNVIVAIP